MGIELSNIEVIGKGWDRLDDIGGGVIEIASISRCSGAAIVIPRSRLGLDRSEDIEETFRLGKV
jgi:hypothetical protein